MGKQRLLILDTNIIVQMMNGTLKLPEILELLATTTAFDMRIGITVFTYWELFKNIVRDEDYKTKIDYLAHKTDFIACTSNIDSSERMNPEYWSNLPEFSTADFTAYLAKIEKNLRNLLVDVVSRFVTSVVMINLIVLFATKNIGGEGIRAFSGVEDLFARDSYVRTLVSLSLGDEWKQKEKSTLAIEKCVLQVLGPLLQKTIADPNDLIKSVDIDRFLHDKKLAQIRKSFGFYNYASPSRFIRSVCKWFCRNQPSDLLTMGIDFLTEKYCFGRKVSINDFIDVLNIFMVETDYGDFEPYYVTKEKFWNDEFLGGYAKDYDLSYRCSIIEFEKTETN